MDCNDSIIAVNEVGITESVNEHKYFDLEVLKSNASAIAFYAKKGFSIFEDDTTHYKMRKSL